VVGGGLALFWVGSTAQDESGIAAIVLAPLGAVIGAALGVTLLSVWCAVRQKRRDPRPE
jgi:hypothetical protein